MLIRARIGLFPIEYICTRLFKKANNYENIAFADRERVYIGIEFVCNMITRRIVLWWKQIDLLDLYTFPGSYSQAFHLSERWVMHYYLRNGYAEVRTSAPITTTVLRASFSPWYSENWPLSRRTLWLVRSFYPRGSFASVEKPRDTEKSTEEVGTPDARAIENGDK